MQPQEEIAISGGREMVSPAHQRCSWQTNSWCHGRVNVLKLTLCGGLLSMFRGGCQADLASKGSPGALTCEYTGPPDLQVEAELVFGGVGGLPLQQLGQTELVSWIQAPSSTGMSISAEEMTPSQSCKPWACPVPCTANTAPRLGVKQLAASLPPTAAPNAASSSFLQGCGPRREPTSPSSSPLQVSPSSSCISAPWTQPQEHVG